MKNMDMDLNSRCKEALGCSTEASTQEQALEDIKNCHFQTMKIDYFIQMVIVLKYTYIVTKMLTFSSSPPALSVTSETG